VKVILHILTKEAANWVPADVNLDFARIPVEGEYLTVASGSPMYLVKLVVHTPFERESKAEVWAVEVDGTQGRYNWEVAEEWSKKTGIKLAFAK